MKKGFINVNLLESKMVLRGFKTRKDFALAVGTTSHTISNLLNGVFRPSHELMNEIYYVLRLTPEEGVAIFFNNNLRNTKVGSGETA